MTHCKSVEIQETCPHVQEYWRLRLIWSNLTAAGLNEWKVLIGGFAEINTLVKCNKTLFHWELSASVAVTYLDDKLLPNLPRL